MRRVNSDVHRRRRRRAFSRASLMRSSAGSGNTTCSGCSVGVMITESPCSQCCNDTIRNSSIQIPKVNSDEPNPLREQVVAEIRRVITESGATRGERLPPAVDLATVLGVNKNTVIRALHILRDEGLLDFTRCRGVRIVGTPQSGAVMARIDELLDYGRIRGYRPTEVVALT